MRNHTRRDWLIGAASAVSGGILLGGRARAADTVRTARVAIARCPSYGSELLPALQTLFDQLGGLERFVKGRTVAIKINLTGSPTYRLGYLPLGDTHYTHPQVIGATVYLMGRAGAKRIRLLESVWATADPIEEYLYRANWNPLDILGAAPIVEFENTNYLGNAREYSRMGVPDGGRMFPAFDLNHSYQDCDTFVSLAKLKEHATAGITLSMKNLFGITPATIYGGGAGVDEPSILPTGGREMIHSGHRQPSKSAPGELDPSSPRVGGYRVPRTVVDLVAARPIDLAIVDGVKTMAGGEGPWIMGVSAVAPGVIVAGTNPVATDAVCMAVMGFDPMVDRGTPPFEKCDSTLRLAEDAGLGPRDLRQIEVGGASIQESRFDFATMRERRKKLYPIEG
jgi:uncharacterized protein (DUF362 family)